MNIFILMIIHFFACLTPGPALLYALDVLTKTNFKNASRVVMGIGLGNAIEIILSIAGISILANIGKKYPTFLYLSCASLMFYLGVKNVMNCINNTIPKPKEKHGSKYFLAGLTITMFNPKVLVFWPLMLAPAVINLSIAFKILTGIYFIVMTFLIVWMDVFLISILKERMIKYLRYIQGIFGLIMLIVGTLLSLKVFL